MNALSHNPKHKQVAQHGYLKALPIRLEANEGATCANTNCNAHVMWLLTLLQAPRPQEKFKQKPKR